MSGVFWDAIEASMSRSPRMASGSTDWRQAISRPPTVSLLI